MANEKFSNVTEDIDSVNSDSKSKEPVKLDNDNYSCPNCKKIEFFLADDTEEGLPQKQCPKCGKQHDFDYPKCPFCRYEYK